jgi:hypothetical protein
VATSKGVVYSPAPRAMGRLDGQLEGGERVLFRTRLHPVVFGGTLFFSGCVAGVAALIVARNALADRTIMLLWLGAAAVVGLSWVSPLLRWRAAEFAATSRRLLVTAGGLRMRVFEVSGAAAQALEVRSTMGGRWLGYGTVRFVGEDGSLHEFPRVARADELRQAVRRHPVASRQRSH